MSSCVTVEFNKDIHTLHREYMTQCTKIKVNNAFHKAILMQDTCRRFNYSFFFFQISKKTFIYFKYWKLRFTELYLRLSALRLKHQLAWRQSRKRKNHLIDFSCNGNNLKPYNVHLNVMYILSAYKETSLLIKEENLVIGFYFAERIQEEREREW